MDAQLLYLIYHALLAVWLIQLAVRDIQTHQIAKRDRLLFLPFALLSLFPNALQYNSITLAFADSLLGSVGAFLMLFLVGTLASRGKEEMALGGGDIKIMLYLGWIYGASGIFIVVFLFALLMLIGGVCQKLKKKSPYGPAMPYISAACLICSISQIILK